MSDHAPRAGETAGTASAPTPALLLAAVRRAELHDPLGRAGADTAAVLAHLALAPRSAAARAARRALAELAGEGLLGSVRIRGRTRWALTGAGHARLAAAAAEDKVPELPESPQHLRWREARRLAAHEQPRSREALRETLTRVGGLLERDPPPRSDILFEAAEELRGRAWRLGAMLHCLHEWREPDDGRADLDERLSPAERSTDARSRARLRTLRAGRRNPRLWREPAAWERRGA